jgi:hypothetical protein
MLSGVFIGQHFYITVFVGTQVIATQRVRDICLLPFSAGVNSQSVGR